MSGNLGRLMGQIAGQMNQSMRASQSASPGGSGKAPNDAEQKAYTKLLDSALKEGDKSRILTLQDGARRAGVPMAPYLEAMGDESPEQQIANFTNQLITDSLGITQPQGPSPFDEAGISLDVPESAQQPKRPSGPAAQQLEKLFTPEFIARTVAKKRTGIDVGDHELTDQDWFNNFAQLPDSMSATDKKELLASKWGYIPAQAAQLRNLPLEERKSVTEGLIVQYMQDPELDETISKFFPKAAQGRTKMGFILNKLSQEGYPIPDRYQPFLDRFINLHDDFAQFDAEKIARQTKVKGFAEEQVEQAIFDDKLNREIITSKSKKKAQLAGEFEMEGFKPISAEDRAKFGIGSGIPTYTDLANQGLRFPSETDRKMYHELSAVRDQIVEMRNLLFGSEKDPTSGVFVGIGKDWVSRKSSQAGLVKDRAVGAQRGQNYEIYSDVLASMARRLLALAGESGGRFTDKDVEQITRSAPDLGGAISPIDSEDIARQKFERFVIGLNKRLAEIGGGVVLKPVGGEQTPAAPPAKSEQFTKGKKYRDAQGNEATYMGDGKWQK